MLKKYKSNENSNTVNKYFNDLYYKNIITIFCHELKKKYRDII